MKDFLTPIGFLLCGIGIFAGVMANYNLRQRVIALETKIEVLESNPTIKAGHGLEALFEEFGK